MYFSVAILKSERVFATPKCDQSFAADRCAFNANFPARFQIHIITFCFIRKALFGFSLFCFFLPPKVIVLVRQFLYRYHSQRPFSFITFFALALYLSQQPSRFNHTTFLSPSVNNTTTVS